MAGPSTLDDATLARRFRNADALAKQGDAKARAAAQALSAEINRRRTGGAASPAPAAPRRVGAGTQQGAVSQYASGLTEGLTRNVVGPVVDLAQGAVNLPGRALNAIRGEEYDPMLEGSVGTTDWWNRALQTEIPDIPLPFTDDSIAMGPMVAPEPQTGGQRFARRAGEFTGTAMGTLAGGSALSRLPVSMGAPAGPAGPGRAILQSMDDAFTRRPVATTLAETIAGATGVGGGMVGGPAGESVAENLGFDPSVGRMVGETAGELVGGLGGAVAGDLGGRGLRFALQDPESAARYAAAARAGIKPTPGLVGNETAAYLENTAGLNPLSGNVVRRPQEAQVEGTAALRDQMTNEMRAPTGALPARNAYEAGVQIRDTGNVALDRLNARLGRLTEMELNSLGGKDAPVSVTNIRRTMDGALPGLDPAGQNVVRDRVQQLEQMRVPGSENIGGFTVPKGTPIDPALDTQLRTRINTQATRIQRLENLKNPTPAQKRQLRNDRYRVQQDIKKIDANLGVPAQQLNAWRMRLGEDTATSGRVDAPVASSTYGAVRADQRETAARQGDPVRFEETVAEKRRIAGDTALEEGGDLEFFKSLTTQGGIPREANSVYNFLTQKDAAGRILRYKENTTPEEFNTTMANMVDLLGRPTSQTARTAGMNTEDFSPRKFMTNWQNLPQTTRDAIFSSADIEARMADLETLSAALSARGTASNPSGTAATAIIAKLFGEGARNLPFTLITLGTNTALTRAFMTDAASRAIAGVNPTLAQDLQALLPARGAGALQTETSQ